MSSNNIIVQEYLSSLKEDGELDYLFPILLSVMGFRIVQTASDSKGQSQYGKDIVAIGKNDEGINFRWYFELKGYKDKDITDKNYSSTDGIRESIIEAKDTAFKDSSIPEFNTLPIKIVLVHNGILKTNIRPTFEGLISREFTSGEFERWDIYYLTDLFSKFLFGEYLLSDSESNRLLKRTLAFLDSPDNQYSDFHQLINVQIEKLPSIKGRALKKFFATINLLASIIHHYSKENNNLIAAKECSDFLVLKVWSWILDNNLEKKEPILKRFRNLLKIQYSILNDYFKKTFPIASIEDGLFAENGTFFESIGYPLRCFEYINDLIYFCELRWFYPSFKYKTKHIDKIRAIQKDKIINLVDNNSGFFRPLLDNHSISIINIFRFFSHDSDLRQEDVDFFTSYIFKVIDGLLTIKSRNGRLPEGYNRIDLVSEYISSEEKPDEYTNDSSILIAILYELLALFNAEVAYKNLTKNLENKVNLQIAHPSQEVNIEHFLFKQHMDAEYYIESYQPMPDDFNEFVKKVKDKKYQEINYVTDEVGFPFLRTLAHKFYKNEFFPYEWRSKFQK